MTSNDESFDAEAFDAHIQEAIMKTPTNKKRKKRKATSPPKSIMPGGLGINLTPLNTVTIHNSQEPPLVYLYAEQCSA
ncbi:hypothetical protein AN958_05132 [Leucoagaricus sp. SymC.cos]|nr:hypothetical protein AN958_05132 [Leucoagaricus sp. SymC.cos]